MPSRRYSDLEQQLRDADHRAAAEQIHFQGRLLDSVREAVVATDTQGRITFWNRFAEELYGWKREEVVGRNFLELVPAAASTEEAAAIFEAMRRGESWSGELVEQTRSGREFSALVTNSPIFDAEGRPIGIIGVSQDITEIRAARLKQAALAQLGTIALGNAGLGFLFNRSAEAVRDLLGADCSEIQKVEEERVVVVGRAGFSSGADAVDNRAALAGLALKSEHGVALERQEEKHAPLRPDQEPGQVCGISVAIATSDQRRWGVLTAFTAEARMTSADVDFLRALANLLGQAIERRRAEVELRIRAAQQSALAEIGRMTTDGVSNAALDRICELVMDALGVENAWVLLPSASRGELTVVAGDNHPPDVALEHALEVAATGDSSVLVDRRNWSGVATPVKTADRNFGVVCGYTTVARQFTGSDVQFLESVAYAMAEAADRDAARSELIESERRFRSVVEGASEIIFSLAPSGEILSINPAFELVTGWRAEEWIGRHFEGLLMEDERERVLPVFASLLTEPRHNRLQVRMQGRERILLIDAATSPKVVDGEVVEIYGFARDITEAHRLEAKLEQADRLSSLGRLAAIVAHEFNNVLMGISPFTELMRREPLTERASAAVDQIGRSVKRGKRITEDILRFAQPAEPALAPVDVAVWLNALAIEARSLAGPKYNVEVEAEEGMHIAADAHQLHQAFVNLILNARDAMPEGGVIAIRARCEPPDAAMEGNFAHFEVQDSGSGMSADTMERVFEPLFTTKKSGTGLGLPVARQVVTRHGGEIYIESTPGAGTTFHLFIPLALAGQRIEPPRSSPDKRPARSVLLVEDDPAVSAGLVALLEEEGVAVRVVETGGEVLPALAESRPDAVILDIGLPDIDGTVVFASIAEAYPDLPVVFSSGHGDAAKLDRFLVRPDVGFLLKPYDIEVLLQMLDRVTR
ncbi:MAG TPA: PAS domain S-box protein [Thermoanaerobaculia bacterium]|nr:PAS domain S-box protein [Thermoanaerobaculia bacterium]